MNERSQSEMRTSVHQRAKARMAMVPPQYRPIVTRPKTEHPRGCRCGHPGSGCDCDD